MFLLSCYYTACSERLLRSTWPGQWTLTYTETEWFLVPWRIESSTQQKTLISWVTHTTSAMKKRKDSEFQTKTKTERADKRDWQFLTKLKHNSLEMTNSLFDSFCCCCQIWIATSSSNWEQISIWWFRPWKFRRFSFLDKK